MIEAPIEDRLKERLESIGFKVLKLVTPGNSGVMDRMILRPKWAPGPPYLVECKRPGKSERLLQEKVRDEWRERGCLVLDVCDSYERVDAIVADLGVIAVNAAERDGVIVPTHVYMVVRAAVEKDRKHG